LTDNGRYEGVRSLLSILLLCFQIAIAAYLWVVDLFNGQRVFGVLVSAMLLAFCMLIYVYRKPSYKELSKSLLLIGYLALALLLSLGVAVTTG
jgi:hypothetical protein